MGLSLKSWIYEDQHNVVFLMLKLSHTRVGLLSFLVCPTGMGGPS
jgi:hypothetical protein